MKNKDKLNILRDILLDDERVHVSTIDEKIRRLEDTINKKNNLSLKVDPIINDKLDDFVQEIPQTLGPKITETLRAEIKNSKEAVVEALYPIMGKMIKKYIQNEISMLVERIDAKVKRTFTFGGFKRKLKFKLNGVKESELIIQDQLQPKIEQVMVIEKGSGILISEYSKTHNIDEEMIAGLLTAIKSFAEDAFDKKNVDLQQIDYELYTVHIQNFSAYYIAVVVSGPFNSVYRDRLEDKLMEFAKNVINKTDLNDQAVFTKKLSQYFQKINFSN